MRPVAGASRSPFDAGRARLAEAFHAVVPNSELRKEPIVAWMPTRGGQPLPSSPLVAEPAGARGRIAIAPWTVTAITPPASVAVEFLCHCAGRHVLIPGVIVAPDLAFCARLVQFAGEMIAREQFLPGLRTVNGVARAVWEPLLLEHSERLHTLCRSMPASVRCVSQNGKAAPQRSPSEVLDAILHELVDDLVRSGIAPAETPRSRGRSRRKPVATFDSPHDHWVHALSSADGELGPAAEWGDLAAQIREWKRPLTATANSAFRLCFRLEEPAMHESGNGQPPGVQPGSGEWSVRFLLQAQDDPSLLIPADDAWQARPRAAIFRRRNFQAREYLLSALGQASGICPRIEASLKTAAPAGYALDGTAAREFLTDTAAALRQAGFGVMLPSWWTGRGTKLRLTVQARVKVPRMTGGSELSLEELVQFDHEIALGEQRVSLRELEQLARLKAPLVNVRGQWVEVGTDEIQAAIKLLRKRRAETASVRDVVRMSLGAVQVVGPVHFGGVSAGGWVGRLLDELAGRAEFNELPPPAEFKGALRPYQRRGYSWLAFLQQWGLGACLADDMGLGKTVQTLALLRRIWNPHRPKPTLLICPTSVVGNWQKEAERFTPDLPVAVHHGGTRAKGAAFRKAVSRHALVISSYSLLHRDRAALEKVDWAGVVLDEAQNIKNPETRQSQAARALRGAFRIALTGTPVENHVGDLWSIMDFLNPGLLGTQADFRRCFFVPIQTSRDPEATERLQRLTGPFILRRLKADKSIISDLPEKLEMKVFCNLTREQASLYRTVVRQAEAALRESEGIHRKGLVLGTLSKLKQVCNHPAQFLGDNSAIPGRSGKLARFVAMLEEVLSVGEAALLFSQFTEMAGILQRHLQETFGREVLFLHGGTTKPQRDRMVERFQSESGPPLFLLSLKAGGTGLNLTRANHVFHFDRWWNPAVENQATDRAFRIGQTRHVQVHKFLCVGTLEEKIDEMIERKGSIARQVVGAGEGWLTELSNEELRDLFALRANAVGE